MRPADHVLDFILVHALERNGIEFDGNSGSLGGVNACKHLVEVTPSRDFPKLRRIKRVERHIDPANTAISQFGRIFAKLRAIGCERQFFETPRHQMPRKRPEQRHDIAPDERFTPRNPEFLDTLIHKNRTQTIKLLERQKILLRQKRHILRHAIDTAKITAVRHRYAQIGD